jgi:predicted transcriptional regulator
MQIYTPKNAYPNSTARLAVIFDTRVLKQYFCVEKHVFMERNDNKRQVARTLFVHGKMTQKEIAAKLEVTEQTVSRWAKKDHWDELKRNMLTGKQEILRSLYAELQILQAEIEKSKRYADSKTADIRRKLITDIRQLETKYSISQTVQIAMDFCEFLKVIDLDLASKMSEYFRAFINEQMDKQKWQK